MTTIAKNGKTTLENLYKDHQAWLRTISFLTQELNWLKERLEEVASKNTSPEIGRWIETYQNRFTVLKENLDILKHDVNESLHSIENSIKEKPNHIHEHIAGDNEVLRNRAEAEEKHFFELKTEFSRFLTKHL